MHNKIRKSENEPPDYRYEGLKKNKTKRGAWESDEKKKKREKSIKCHFQILAP